MRSQADLDENDESRALQAMGRGHTAARSARRGLIEASAAARPYHRRATSVASIAKSSNTAADAESPESPDTVIRLRGWGSERVHALPPPTQNAWVIGTSSVCTLRLNDPEVAPEHVLLTHEDGQWWFQALGIANSVRQDGVLRRRFSLTSGTEIGIGMTTLLAESSRAAQLHGLCRRLLGWSADRLSSVDRALRAIRLARTGHNPLLLCGDNDLVPIAHLLHRYTLGSTAPFILCDRHRKHSHASSRSPANIPCGIDALTAANGGTLCIRRSSWPHDINAVMRRLYEPGCHVQLFLCMQYGRRKTVFAGAADRDSVATRTSPRADEDHRGIRAGCNHLARRAPERISRRGDHTEQGTWHGKRARCRTSSDRCRAALARPPQRPSIAVALLRIQQHREPEQRAHLVRIQRAHAVIPARDVPHHRQRIRRIEHRVRHRDREFADGHPVHDVAESTNPATCLRRSYRFSPPPTRGQA
jgi:hypothetical protein